MKKGIVFKLFLLTTALCLFILAIVFVGQTLFFKQMYVHQKVASVKSALEAYEQEYLNHTGNAQAMVRLDKIFIRSMAPGSRHWMRWAICCIPMIFK